MDKDAKTEKEQRAKAMKRTTKNKLGTSEVMMNLMPLQTFTRCVGGWLDLVVAPGDSPSWPGSQPQAVLFYIFPPSREAHFQTGVWILWSKVHHVEEVKQKNPWSAAAWHIYIHSISFINRNGRWMPPSCFVCLLPGFHGEKAALPGLLSLVESQRSESHKRMCKPWLHAHSHRQDKIRSLQDSTVCIWSKCNKSCASQVWD